MADLQMMPPRVPFARPANEGSTDYLITAEWWKWMRSWFQNSGGDSSLTYAELLELINQAKQLSSRNARDGENGRDSRIPGPAGADGAQGAMGPPGRRGEDGRTRYIMINP